MENIRESFAVIEDARDERYVEHKLTDILIIVMCAVICGQSELEKISEYGKQKAVFLKEKFGVEKSPSKATLSRVLGMLDGEKVAQAVIEIMRENIGVAGEIIAVDGKAIRSTGKSDRPHPMLQILSAYMTESGVTIGQRAVHEKTNEIPVFQDMLDDLNVRGKTITADAMHCQKETCRKIIAKGGDYCFGLKGNQKTFHDEIAEYFADKSLEVQAFTTREKNAGRIEIRECMKIPDISWFSDRQEWPGLKSVFAVTRITEARGKRTEETSYYISSLDAGPERLLQIVREHWKIESLHWLLDVDFGEDATRMISENANKSLNAFRKLALALHKAFIGELVKARPSMKTNMFRCLLDEALFVKVLGVGL